MLSPVQARRQRRGGDLAALDARDKDILRELARQVAAIAADPVQEQRRQLWTKLNRLERCRIPLLLVMHDLYWHELVPESDLLAVDPFARAHELALRLKLWHWEHVEDDAVTEPVVEYDIAVDMPHMISPRKTAVGPKGETAYVVVPVIETEADIDKIVEDTTVTVDWDATARERGWVEEVFDGILSPAPTMPDLRLAPFDYACEIRGMERAFIDLFERPEWFEEVMRRVYRVGIDAARSLEQRGVLTINTGERVGSGGLGYTDELPRAGFDPAHVRLEDVWGSTTAQAAVGISAEMYERFVAQFDREYHALFGLTAVGCCEPVDRKMPVYRTLPNLRRVSISAFNDFAMAAEGIGTDYVYSVKPIASYMCLPSWDADADLGHLERTLEQSRGCHVEIIQRELASCAGRPERLTEWFRRANQLVERYSA